MTCKNCGGTGKIVVIGSFTTPCTNCSASKPVSGDTDFLSVKGAQAFLAMFGFQNDAFLVIEKEGTPSMAYNLAKHRGRPCDRTRAVICSKIRGNDHLDSAYYAFRYARDVDQNPRDDTREAACLHPSWGTLYARNIDKHPRDDTRSAACKDPWWAIEYALQVDKGPLPFTRRAASKTPETALRYAEKVDQRPHYVTRQGACSDPSSALKYALDIDQGHHPLTWKTLADDIDLQIRYRAQVLNETADQVRVYLQSLEES